MSLTDLLTNGKPRGHKADKVLIAYEQLPEFEQEAFRQLIEDGIWSGPQIAAVLRDMGHDIHGDQVQALRNKIRSGKVTL